MFDKMLDSMFGALLDEQHGLVHGRELSQVHGGMHGQVHSQVHSQVHGVVLSDLYTLLRVQLSVQFGITFIYINISHEGAVDFGGEVKAGDGYVKVRRRVEWHHKCCYSSLVEIRPTSSLGNCRKIKPATLPEEIKVREEIILNRSRYGDIHNQRLRTAL